MAESKGQAGAIAVPESDVAEHILVGRVGEDAAVSLLREKGLKILDRNWRKGRLELDIVCADREAIVFVEVKTRQARGMSDPAAALTLAKRRLVIKAAQAWLAAHDAWRRPCRFDVVCVRKDGLTLSAEHYRHAFDFSSALGGGHAAWQPW